MAWSFDGVSFAVAQDAAFVEEWFPRQTEASTRRILGSSGLQVVQIGASGITGTLEVIAQFTDKATRDSLLAKEGETGTLADDDGRSAVVLLQAAQPVRVIRKDSGLYRLNCLFAYVESV